MKRAALSRLVAGSAVVASVVLVAPALFSPQAGATHQGTTPPIYPLTMSMTGPSKARVGHPVTYTVRIQNVATYTVRNVTVCEKFNSGGADWNEESKFTISEIRPGQVITRVISDGSPGGPADGSTTYVTQYLAEIKGMPGAIGAFSHSLEIR